MSASSTPGRRHRCPSMCGRDHDLDGGGGEREPLIRATSRSAYGTQPSLPGATSSEEGSEQGGSGQHCHIRGFQEERLDKRARRKLILASILCLLFMLGEALGGIFANSLAIATDAAHLLTDFASFMISLFALFIASRPPTKRMSFGWYRAEVLGALISVLLIWVVTAVLVFMAVQRIVSNEYEINASIMLITAGVGVTVNIIMGITLHDTHGHSHGGHSHGHSHSSSEDTTTSTENPRLATSTTVIPNSPDILSTSVNLEDGQPYAEEHHEVPKKHKTNINVRAAFIHVMGDLLQSIGVLIAAFIIYFKPEYKIADPICTFLFSILVVITTITILRDTINVFMEGTPRGISFNEVKQCFCRIQGVREIHNLRIWSLTMSKAAVSVHLALENSVNAQEVLATAGRLMRENFGIHECTIQIEDYVDEMQDCTQCQDPKD